MRTTLLTLLCLLACAGCATYQLGTCPARGGYPWRRLTSAHFELETDLDSLDAARSLRELEWYRAALRESWGTPIDPPGRVEVIVYRDWTEFAQVRNERLFGVTSRNGPHPLIAMATETVRDDSWGRGNVRVHELTHYLAAYVLPRQPHWLAEGLATFYETMKFDEVIHQLVIGIPAYRLRDEALTAGIVPVATLLDPRTRLSTRFYASSWLFVHYLIYRQPERFAAFERLLAGGRDPADAWARAFVGVAPGWLDQQLRAYVNRLPEPRSLPFQPPADPQILPAALTDADYHLLQARVWLYGSQNAQLAERKWHVLNELAEALRQDPNHPQAQLFQAELLDNTIEQLTRARMLATTYPESGRVWALLATTLRRAGTVTPEQTHAVDRAAELSQSDPQVLTYVAGEYGLRGDGERALQMAEKAVELAPWRPEGLTVYASLLAAIGRCEPAKIAQQRAIDALPDLVAGQTHDRYQDVLSRIEQSCRSIDKLSGSER